MATKSCLINVVLSRGVLILELKERWQIMSLLPNDYERSLFEHILPTGFIKDGFITTHQKPSNYSYEDFIIEYLNESAYFMDKTDGELFYHSNDESKGQCDAITNNYSLDFKLILGQSMQYAKNLTSEQIDTNGKGVVYYSIAKGKGEYRAIWLHKALRDLTKENLEQIINDGATNELECDVLAYMESIDKEKNLLLFYPVIFEYCGTDICTAQSIANIICNDFCESLKVRTSLHPNHETYVSFLYEKSFHVALFNKEKLELKDSIHASNSKCFEWIKDFYWSDEIISKLL